MNRSFATLKYTREGWIFNVICGVYFLLLARWVREISISNIHEEDTYLPLFGITVLVISLLEIYALPVKLKFVHHAVREHDDSAGSGFYLWVFHTVISIILTFSIFQAFGFETTRGEDSELPGWMAGIMVLVVIKELVFLGFIFTSKTAETIPEKYRRPQKREWVADIILTIYACLAFTVTWETIASNVDMQRDNPVMFVINLILSSILFLMFYLPLRIPYHIEEMAQLKTRNDWLRWAASLLFVLVPAIWAAS
ncbi:MAG: hypothetical protein HKN23_12615 [Verrucomicrobiales bacterium]|nr:hypothetical protein [Verrucomicrobiales bacterium]